MPAMYTPPICRIFSRESWRPKRNAIVMRRIENEHGCTLSRSDEMSTSGKSQTPPPLALQMSPDVARLNLRTMTPRMNAPITPAMIRIRFMSGCYERLYLKLKRSAGGIGEHYESVNLPDAGRAVRIPVVNNADDAALAGFNGFICGRDIPHSRHAERSFRAPVRLDDECSGAHAGSQHGFYGDVLVRRIGDSKFFGHVPILH